jgi:hypothetical protein
LAANLQLDESEVRQLLELTVEKIDESNGESEQEFNDFQDRCLVVSVLTSNPDIIGKLQESIINYLSRNEMISLALSTRTTTLNNLIGETEKEIKEIEELQLSLIEAVKGGNDMFYMTQRSTTHADKMDLYKQKEKYSENLKFLSAMSIIKPFNLPENPISKKLFHTSAMGILFFLFSLAIGGWKEINTRLL